MTKQKKQDIYFDGIGLTIFLIILCSAGLTGSFIYSTHNDPIDESSPYTRVEAYVLFGIASVFLFTLFWGFIYMAGKPFENNDFTVKETTNINKGVSKGKQENG